ncbi:MAG: alpha-hydroxy-acid oxidizing protein [Alphaproteobacteria bacterium]|nr:MAG: alpha-hydroxy-acid oxidizing protein [Alphaproteobacteria bacterium]TMJ92739.1 MAG: alpha-hydroxy-acid oxidizing protein [Alphaproteobacteria bacterium]TMK05000.1 MAG: alpha-hydroxy-acid oxidizing protein [Alphaproteobacteria bacterium]
MHDTTALLRSAASDYTPADNSRFPKLHRRFPTTAYLRQHARSHVPSFAFEYMDGGAGGDGGIARNWNAFDAIELVPRYGVTTTLPAVDIELFGRRYSAPIGIAPMGGPSIVWPGADQYLAAAAQRARVPYVLGLVGGMMVEHAAEIAPDVLWFQLYRCFRNEHAIGFDLLRRAQAAGVHVLVLTADVPVRTTRPREVVAGITSPFQPDLRMFAAILRSPGYLQSLWKHGQPRFGNLKPYAGDTADVNEVAAFVRREMAGAFTWEEIGRYRERWKAPLVVKGLLHPADAERCVSLGVDGIIISNHGGRQVEGLPPAIDVLPAIARAVGGRATVMVDSGIRSGLDVVRAVALGADAAFAGKAFLWGLGALGAEGPLHVIDLMIDEMRAAFGQIGARRPAQARSVVIRHPGALHF